MSALNVFIRKDRAWMQTDASLYDQQGNIVAFGPKAYVLSNLRAVISARGLQSVTPMLVPILGWQFATFDDLIEHGAPVIRNVFCEFVKSYVAADAAERDIELIILGWSEKEDGPRAYRFYSDAVANLHGDAAFEFHPFASDETWELSPAFQTLEPWNRLGRQGIELDENGFTTEQFDPVTHGLAYMEEQRHIYVDFETNKQISICGGFLASVEISRDGVSEKILHRWPDKVGEPIRPEPRPSFENVSPLRMNRQQRRAADRFKIA